MANTDGAFGLRPYRHMYGGVNRLSAFSIADAYNTDIFTGDPVLSSGTTKGIVIGTAGGNIRGVFWGCHYTKADGEPAWGKQWPANTALLTGTVATAYVYDDPFTMFAIQAATGQQVDIADIQLLADLVSGTGDARSGQSRWELGGHDGGEAQCLIVELVERADNAYGEHAEVGVLLMEHELRNSGVEV